MTLNKASTYRDYHNLISMGLLTINEVREYEGLSPIENYRPVLLSEGMKIERIGATKQICSYCARPNGVDDEVCESCGAPLPLMKEQ